MKYINIRDDGFIYNVLSFDSAAVLNGVRDDEYKYMLFSFFHKSTINKPTSCIALRIEYSVTTLSGFHIPIPCS